jgi:hypothetical protein
MASLLHFEFPYSGPFGEDSVQDKKELAQSIAQVPGLIWKIWIESEETGMAGGTYLFADSSSAQAYLDMHKARLAQFGVSDVKASFFEVNEGLSNITRFSLS